MANTTYSHETSDPYINGVLGDTKWATSSLSYSFPGRGSFYGRYYGWGETENGFASFNSAQVLAARSALASYAAVANLRFVEITETSSQHATVRFGLSDQPDTAWAYFPSGASEGGDVWLNRSSGSYSRPQRGNYAYATFLHELGHSLGLEHTHEHHVMPLDRDSMEYSVMSYRSYIGGNDAGYTNEAWGYAQTPMVYDIAGLQHMYGANFRHNSGNTVYSWSPTTGEQFVNGKGQGAPGGNRIFQTVWDGGGNDTYDFSAYRNSLRVDLGPGKWTTTSPAQRADLHYNGTEVAAGNIANALQYKSDPRSLIENAIGGSSSDLLYGNGTANRLEGRSGDDRLYGSGGNDRLVGGAGKDHLDGGRGSDHADYGSAKTTDSRRGIGLTVDLLVPGRNTGEAAGDTFFSIESLAGSRYNDTLWGSDSNNALEGRAGNDRLIGRKGNDKLFGHDGNDQLTGGLSADWLSGGAGADVFVFQACTDSAPNGFDIITDFVSRTDRISLAMIDADITRSGDQAFSFVGSKAFSGKAGELRFAGGTIFGDVNGDGAAEIQIATSGLSALSGSDFFA